MYNINLSPDRAWAGGRPSPPYFTLWEIVAIMSRPLHLSFRAEDECWGVLGSFRYDNNAQAVRDKTLIQKVPKCLNSTWNLPNFRDLHSKPGERLWKGAIPLRH